MKDSPNALARYLEGRKRSEFAALLGISAGYLTQLASNARTPGLDLALRIERATGGKVSVGSWFEDAA